MRGPEESSSEPEGARDLRCDIVKWRRVSPEPSTSVKVTTVTLRLLDCKAMEREGDRRGEGSEAADLTPRNLGVNKIGDSSELGPTLVKAWQPTWWLASADCLGIRDMLYVVLYRILHYKRYCTLPSHTDYYLSPHYTTSPSSSTGGA